MVCQDGSHPPRETEIPAETERREERMDTINATRAEQLPTKMILIILVTLCICHLPTESSGKAPPFHLRIGFSSRCFVNVPREDIRIALQVLSRKVARKTVGSAESKIYDSPGEIERDLKSGMLDVVALTPEEFIQLRKYRILDPVMTTVSGASHEFRLYLLVRKDGRFGKPADLKMRRISIPSVTSQYGSMFHAWVNTLVMHEGAGTPQAFFSSINETRSGIQALMSLFFRTTDACVVTDQTYNLAAELNPQFTRELMLLASCERLTGGIIAMRNDQPAEQRRRVVQALTTLHEDHEGRQMFVLFQLSRLIPFHPDHLRGVETLYGEQDRLKERLAKQWRRPHSSLNSPLRHADQGGVTR